MDALPYLEEALQLREQALPYGDPAIRHLKHRLVDLYHTLGMPLPPSWPAP